MTVWFAQTIVPGSTGFPADRPDWWIGSNTPINIAAVNNSDVDATISYTYRDGNTQTDTIAAYSAYELPGASIVRFSVAGNGATINLWMGWPEQAPPKYTRLGSPSNTASIILSTSIPHSTDKEVYKCPPSTRARLQAFTYLDGGSASALGVIIATSGSFSPPTATEVICNALAVGAGLLAVYGASSGGIGGTNVPIVRNSTIYIFPGQSLWVSGSGATASTFNYSILEEPL